MPPPRFNRARACRSRERPLCALLMNDAAIRIEALSKTYQRGKQALKEVSFDVPRGQIFGLLGPNGAGKSTLINILAGLVVKTSGKVTIWGFDIAEHPRNAKRSIGVVPQEIIFDPFFTPRETLEIQAGLYGIAKSDRKSDELLAAMHLTDKAHAYSRTLSGGMKRRLLVAKAMVHSPPILVLDEPTAGVDVELRRQLWDYVRQLHATGVTIVLTTHYLEEAEELCDRIAIIHHGRVIANEPTRDLVAKAQEKAVVVTFDRDIANVPTNACFENITLIDERTLEIIFRKDKVNAGQVLAALAADGLGIVDVTTRDPDLEDVFLSLVSADQEAA
jgi:ABC-2 type transport system ATP-binding protein